MDCQRYGHTAFTQNQCRDNIGKKTLDLVLCRCIQERIGEQFHFGDNREEVLADRKGMRELPTEKIQNGVGIEKRFQDHSCRMRD